MEPIDKNLLIKDLCARLPYHVIVKYRDANVDLTKYVRSVKIEECKPYLRPISSMTEEEKNEYDSFFNLDYGYMDAGAVFDVADWINAHHFDFRGLIEKGLALEAPEYMYMHLKT